MDTFPDPQVTRASLREQRSTGWDAYRDKMVCHLANAVLRMATPWYRSMVGGAIRYGLDSAARDAQEGRAHPPVKFVG